MSTVWDLRAGKTAVSRYEHLLMKVFIMTLEINKYCVLVIIAHTTPSSSHLSTLMLLVANLA